MKSMLYDGNLNFTREFLQNSFTKLEVFQTFEKAVIFNRVFHECNFNQVQVLRLLNYILVKKCQRKRGINIEACMLRSAVNIMPMVVEFNGVARQV